MTTSVSKYSLHKIVPVWIIGIAILAGCTSDVDPVPSPSVTYLPPGHGSIWSSTEEVEIGEVEPLWFRRSREGSSVFVVPDRNSVEFWTGLYGRPEPEPELYINHGGYLIPDHLLDLGGMFAVNLDGTFDVAVPPGEYVLCVGTMEDEGFRSDGCDIGQIDERHVYVYFTKGALFWHSVPTDS